MISSLLTVLGILAASASGSLCNKAHNLYDCGEIDAAAAIALEAAEKSLASSDTVDLIKAWCLLCEISIDRGDDMGAVEYYNRCADLSLYCEPMFMLSSSLYNIASIYFQNGEYEKALEYIKKSILIDSRRKEDSVHALRYLLYSEILYHTGNYEKAVEMAEIGRKFNEKRRNCNIEARLKLVQAKCHEAACADSVDWKTVETEYRDALETLNETHSGHYYGAVNPYAPEFLYHLGLAVQAQGLDAREYFSEAVRISSSSQKMRGSNPVAEIESCKALADILLRDGDTAGAQPYIERAEELSYVPYVQEMNNKLSLSQMEFIRREKELEIERQKNKAFHMLLAISALIVATIGLSLMYRRQSRQKKEIELKNSQLIKLGLQKDKLIEILKESSSAAASDGEEIRSIADDSVPLPDIKLSKRETEVLLYCCKGLISKEIAAKMGVSVRTVESHKMNLFRKVGVNTTGELIAFAFKSGIVQ